MNKTVLAIMVLALVGGGVVGMAMTGMIDIPGLSPVKKKNAEALYEGDAEGKIADAAALYGDKDAKPAAAKVEPPKSSPKTAAVTPPVKPKVVIDPEVGRKKVAKLWNEMSVEALAKLVGKGTDPDLPRVLAIMDSSKVSKLLESLAPDLAMKLSKAIQKEASRVKTG